jgi:hypothetical protein
MADELAVIKGGSFPCADSYSAAVRQSTVTENAAR